MKRLLLFLTFSAIALQGFSQDRVVTGTVTSKEDGATLIGVTVLVKNTVNGAITDIDGKYRINLSPSDSILVFSYIGYQNVEIAVKKQRSINVTMSPDVQELNEVVVTGYSQQEKKTISGSISSISAEDFKEMPVVGMDQALQGRAAGVMVTQSSGTPGGGMMIRVRGNSSISGSNSPLFIVDGIPVAQGNLTGRSFGGQGDNALSTINPNDIESIQILKDASAKAIYGSRASNGVVLITTKKGKTRQKTKINFETQRGVIDPVGRIDLLNSEELLELQRETYANAGDDPDKAGIPGITDGVDTDWIDVVTRQAIVQSYQLSAQGGSNKTKFYISAAYRDEEGVIQNNKFERWSGTFNIDHNATDKFRFGINMTMARTLNKRVKGDNFLDGVYSGAIRSLPWYEPYNEEGRLNAPGDVGYADFPNFNPLAQATEPRFDTHANKLTGGLYAEYDLTSDLVFKTKFSIDYNGSAEDQFEPSTTAIGGTLDFTQGQGYGIYSTFEGATLLNTTLLTYNKQISDKHRIGILLGGEVLKSTSRGGSASGILFPNDQFTYLQSAGLVFDGSSYLVESGLLSAFAEVNYDYEEKYLVKLNARYDGSSRFGEDKRFGFFPAASLGWRIAQESFMENIEKISELKLRASAGVTGNQSIGNFLFLESWAAGTAYNGVPAIAPVNLANPLLQWEQTLEGNVGLDLGFFDNRLEINLDAYYNVTGDLLLSETLPFTTGFGSVQGNLGEIVNKGLELNLNGVIIDKNFKWNAGMNLSGNRNEVVELATDEPQYAGYQTFTNSTHIITPGSPLGTFWGLRFLGVDPGTGDAIYDDINNDGQLTADDGVIIGNAQPDLTGGFTSNMYYKNFDLAIFFQFSYGNEMINFANTGLLNSGENVDENQITKALQRWRKPGDITDVPRYELGNTFNNRFSSRFVEDGSYLRLKNVSLGYNIPDVMLNKIKLSSARIYVSGTNLYTLTNYSGADPEVNTNDGSTVSQGMDFYTFPQVRTMLVGLNIGF
ncbi:TonB-dependent receptor [Flammeovirgaceae bacterium SG7u.111]|nr:TonB-dependent receptor [Flammeovirgaceae bacterium SG7u.132]WPO36812.1 TonB-dependent receptor [Flammeovirgaceae bacterium SG7u.111]